MSLLSTAGVFSGEPLPANKEVACTGRSSEAGRVGGAAAAAGASPRAGSSTGNGADLSLPLPGGAHDDRHTFFRPSAHLASLSSDLASAQGPLVSKNARAWTAEVWS